jgi:hypothetical protein
MKFLRFVSLFAVCLVMLVAAESNPVTYAKESTALRAAEEQVALAQPEAGGQTKLLATAILFDSGGAAPTSLATADLNGDGHQDLVVADPYNGICVLLGNGDGTFQPPVTYFVNTNPASLFVAIGDVNGDGHPDIVVSSYEDLADYPGTVNVLLGNGDGTFETAISYSSGGAGASSVAIKDVNGDGKPDLLVADGCQSLGCTTGFHGGVSVLLGNGDGTFQTAVTYDSAGADSLSIAVADINGDGHVDVVVANQCQSVACGAGDFGGVSVLLGNGDGTFQAAVSYPSSGVIANSVVIGDINGDGHPDVVVANACQTSSCNSGGMSVLLGNGDGTLQEPASYNSGGYAAGPVALADLNGDGKTDAIVLGRTAPGLRSHGEVSVLINNGDGTFQSPARYSPHGIASDSVVVGDMNGDGKIDVAVLNRFPESGGSGPSMIGLFLNTVLYKTTAAVTSSPNPSVVNQKVTLTSTISSTQPVPNGETVTFYDGATSIGAGTTTNGVASLTTSFSKAKTHTIKAAYPGDTYHKASSRTVKQVVNP